MTIYVSAILFVLASITSCDDDEKISPAEFSITAIEKDFGTIEVEQSINYSLKVTNEGEADLEIDEFVLKGTNAADFSTSVVPKIIKKNQSYSFEITFAPLTEGEKEAILEITTNVGKKEITVTGIVINDSIPLESASVMIKNSTNGIATNNKGEFKLEAKKGDTLSVSYLGYKTKELVLNKTEDFTFKLDEENSFNEVVIIGYSSHKCKISCGVCVVYSTLWVDEDEKTKLYPNPSSNGIFQLMLVNNYNKVSISIADMSGRSVQNITQQKFGKKGTIDLSTYPTGIYIVNIIADGKRLEPIKAIKS